VQLADAPAEEAVVVDFVESSGSATIAFLLVFPLREKKAEFETGAQMTARHLAWAREASGGTAPDVLTSSSKSGGKEGLASTKSLQIIPCTRTSRTY
jgi:hypothetical protein